MRQRTAGHRTAFTLVELLVAMALIILIMSILSQAFVEGLKLFRETKGIGDMQENLRTAIVLMRDDLLQRHFDGTEKLGSSFDRYNRPTTGFFRVQQGSPSTWEGSDADGLPSYRATNHVLHLSVTRTGTRRPDYQSGEAPVVPPGPEYPARHFWEAIANPDDYRQNGIYLSQSAEVIWFLVPMNQTCGASDTPLYSLHRRQRLLVDNRTADRVNNQDRIAMQYLGRYADLACKPSGGVLRFSTAPDTATPANRSMTDSSGNFSLPHAVGTPYPGGHPAFGVANIEAENTTRAADDRVISDVISFEVKLLFPPEAFPLTNRGAGYRFLDVFEARQLMGGAWDPSMPPGMAATPQNYALNHVYDTATWPVQDPANNGGGPPVLPPGQGGIPPGQGGVPPGQLQQMERKLTVKALQIVVRVWDAKTEQTRQMTLIQDM